MTTLLTGDLIRAARALIGMSQVDLAKKAGITQKALGNLNWGNDRLPQEQTTSSAGSSMSRKSSLLRRTSESSHLEGTGVRWKPSQPNSGIKTI